MANNLLLSVFLGLVLLVSGICTAEAPETNAHLYPDIVKYNHFAQRHLIVQAVREMRVEEKFPAAKASF